MSSESRALLCLTAPEGHRAAEQLRQRSPVIIATWSRLWRTFVANQQVEAADAALIGALPHMLENLARALENDSWTYEHVRHDYDSAPTQIPLDRYTLAQIVDAYAWLRQALIMVWLDQYAGSARIVGRIHACIDAWVRQTVSDFATLNKQAESARLLAVAEQARVERDTSRDQIQTLRDGSQLQERFVALLSHDLRAPLQAVGISADRLERRADDPVQVRRIAGRIRHSTSRMDHMICDMLDLSRLRAGQALPICVEPSDLAQVVQQACDDLILVHGSRICLNTPRGSVPGYWDCGAVQRVIENLVVNAIKYGDRDKQVSVTVVAVDGAAVLSVHNHGNPLSQTDLDTLFEPYQQKQVGVIGQAPSWGLGLTLVRAVAEAHGGSAGVSSNPGSGTRFWVKLAQDCRPHCV